MHKSFKVSLYIRVSTGRQATEGDSLEEQEKELKKFFQMVQVNNFSKRPIKSGRFNKFPSIISQVVPTPTKKRT